MKQIEKLMQMQQNWDKVNNEIAVRGSANRDKLVTRGMLLEARCELYDSFLKANPEIHKFFESLATFNKGKSTSPIHQDHFTAEHLLRHLYCSARDMLSREEFKQKRQQNPLKEAEAK